MERGAIPRRREPSSQHPSSPNASSSSSSCNSGEGNGGFLPPATSNTPPQSPLTHKSIPQAAATNPFQTTIVQADSSSFKQVVQMLTGSAKTASTTTTGTPSATKPPGPKKPAFKLYERRNSTKNLKMISPLIPAVTGASKPNSPATGGFSARKQPEILSPSILYFPSLAFSPVTPLISDPFGRSPAAGSVEAMKAEEKAIADKGFYFHPSPRTTAANSEPPKLLPLFPVTSPRVSSSSP